VLPFLERLLYRPRDVASIRVLVITPTRELALQIHNVLEKLAQFTDVTSVLICGGKKDVRSQEVTLRTRPDIVVSGDQHKRPISFLYRCAMIHDMIIWYIWYIWYDVSTHPTCP
jgi:hypothetical protein